MERAAILKINSYLSLPLATSCHLLSFLFAWCLGRQIVFWQMKLGRFLNFKHQANINV